MQPDEVNLGEQIGTVFTRPRTERQLARQEKCFEASVLEGKTIRVIAKEMRIALQTVIDDIREESRRRAEELASHRDTEQARHLSMVSDLYQHSLRLRSTPGTGALGSAAKALEMRAKLLGLESATRIDVSIQKLIDAFEPPTPEEPQGES